LSAWRRWLLLAAHSGLTACQPVDDSGLQPSFVYELDDWLRLQHLQAKGTHNSYHLAPGHDVIEAWRYSHAPMEVQLACQGVRQFELDVYWDEQGGFEVYHVPALDDETNCASLRECLGRMRAWSDLNPAHHPLFVMIEPKDSYDEDTAELLLADLESAVADAWPRERIVTPDEVRGEHPDLASAMAEEGWPVLGQLRGHLLLWLLDTGPLREIYTWGGLGLQDRLLFVKSDPEHPFAAVMMRDDPDSEDIAELVRANYLVRTRADSESAEVAAGDTSRREAALSSGATMVSTDYPAPVEGLDYHVEIPGGTPSRCNPLNAPADCSSRDIEDPEFTNPAGC